MTQVQAQTSKLAEQWRQEILRDQNNASGTLGAYDEARIEQKGYCAGELESLIRSNHESERLEEMIKELVNEWKTEKIGEDLQSVGKEEQMRSCALDLEEAITG
jgi:hypothetical protein